MRISTLAAVAAIASAAPVELTSNATDSAAPVELTSNATNGHHLWFRGFKPAGTVWKPDIYSCGEVDAAPRMPAALFHPSNAAALKAYVDITLALYVAGPYKLDVHLELGRCADKRYTKKTLYPYQVNWAPIQLMGGICKSQCNCDFPNCPDVPDDPGTWCSLCGPRYNAPNIVTFYNFISLLHI